MDFKDSEYKESDTRKSINHRMFFWALLLLLLAIYTLVAVLSRYLMYDFFGYITLAQELPRGGWVHTAQPAGYRLLLRIFYELAGDYAISGKLIGLIMAAAALYITKRFATVLSQNEVVGIVVMFFTGINRHFFHWATVPSTDLPALAFALAGMYVLIRYRLGEARNSNRAMLWSGVLFGLGYLMRYSVIIPAIISGAWLILQARKLTLWSDLKKILLYSAGFFAITLIQVVPSFIRSGSLSSTALTRMIWSFYESEATGVSFTVLIASPDAPESLYSWVLWLKGNLMHVLGYWARNLFSYLAIYGYRIIGPVWFLLVYPAIVIVPLKASKIRREVTIYIFLTVLAVVLFYSLLMFVARYILIAIPVAITFSTMLVASIFKWLRILADRFQAYQRLTRFIKAVVITFVLLLIIANMLSEFRVIYLMQLKDNHLYSIVNSALRDAGMDSATQVGTVFLSRKVFYNLDSPVKSQFDEIILAPNSSVLDLRSEMVKENRTYVIIDDYSQKLQPVLASILLNPNAQDELSYSGLEKVLFYPEDNPNLAIYRLKLF